MKKKKIIKTVYNLFFKLKFFIQNILLKILVKIIPKIDREHLIKIGKKKKSICIVEDEYKFLIREPDQFLAKKNYCILPNALAVTYAIAIASKKEKIKNIFLAGIDGYDNLNSKNNELNLTFQLIKANTKCNILSITPTALNLDIKSLFSFEI